VEQAAAQYLGPVHKLWEGGAKTRDSFQAGTGLSAKAKVGESPCARLQARTPLIRIDPQGLSLSMLELLLGSEHLILDYEEDTFALITGWADGRREREKEAAFNRLWPCLRLHHMSPIFLTSVVAEHKMSAKVGARLIMDAVAYHSISASLRLPDVMYSTTRFASYKPSRALGNSAPYHFEVDLDLADCMALEDLQKTFVMLGVTAGYRVYLMAKKVEEPATLGIFVGLEPIFPVAGGALPGPITQLRIEAGGSSRHYITAMELPSGFGSPNFFDKPWEEVVYDGSPYLPHGRMSVKVITQLLTDEHVEPVVGDLP
jgi:hypothetical protein